MLAKLAAILTSIVSIWSYLVKRRQQIWAWIITWNKRRRENQVDKAVDSNNVSTVINILRAIKAKRKKRQSGS